MANELSLKNFIDLDQCLHGSRIDSARPFQYVGNSLEAWLRELLTELKVGSEPMIKGSVDGAAIVKGPVYVAEGAMVEATALVNGPCYIGPGAQVRHGAYIRGNAYIGPNSVVGHATEVKGAMFFDGAKAGHFAYVGDALLGREVNLGAGTKLANLPFRRREIRIKHPETGKIISTGLKKFSALMGDSSQTGCNAVLSPGTLLYPQTVVSSCVHFRGTLTQGTIFR